MIAPPWISIPPKGYGGTEMVLNYLIPGLIEQGIEVELFATGDSTIKATKVHWLYNTGQYAQLHKQYYDVLPTVIAHVMFALNTIKKDGHFDLIHDHNGFIGPMAISITKGLPPAVHTLHGPLYNTEEELMWVQLSKTPELNLIPISKSQASLAPKAIKKNMLRAVHHGINVEDYPYLKDKKDYFLTMARFHPDKGQDLAVKAAVDLGEHLIMAGGVAGLSSSREVLLELGNPLSLYRSKTDFKYFSDKIFSYLFDNQIDYVGEAKGAIKLKLLSEAKALLSPIQWEEPFGLAIIEALACGTPVIAANRGALPEIIKHGVNGFLVKNERELKSYMKRVNEIDPKACRDSVIKHFSDKVMANNYIKHYEKITSKRI